MRVCLWKMYAKFDWNALFETFPNCTVQILTPLKVNFENSKVTVTSPCSGVLKWQIILEISKAHSPPSIRSWTSRVERSPRVDKKTSPSKGLPSWKTTCSSAGTPSRSVTSDYKSNREENVSKTDSDILYHKVKIGSDIPEFKDILTFFNFKTEIHITV